MLLLLRERHRRRRRRRVRDDRQLAVRRLGQRHRRAAMHALLHRRDRGDVRDRRAERRFSRQRHGGSSHRLRLREGLRRHGDHRTAHLLVDIDRLHDVRRVVDDGRVRDVRRVVDVGDGGGRDHRIAAIDVVEIAAAHRIRRLIDLARREREPADRGGHDAAHRRRDLEVPAADEGDQRRRIYRLFALRAGHPAPGAVEVGPAAVVRHGKAPGGVVDPGPAPGIDPGPVAVVVRRPAGGDTGRRPDAAVGRIGAPAAVGIEILVADDFLRHVASRRRRVGAAIAITRPAVEVVVATHGQRVVVGQAGAVEAIALPRRDRIRSAVAVDLGLAVLHRHRRRVVVGIDIDAVVAGAADREREVGRVDLEALFRREVAHADLQRALRQLDLGDAVVEIEKRHAAAGAEPDRGAADLHLGARARVGPETVAGRQRPVDHRLHPVGLRRRRKTHRAADVAQARRARWRLGRSEAAPDECQAAQQQCRGPAKGLCVHRNSFEGRLRRERACATRAAARSAQHARQRDRSNQSGPRSAKREQADSPAGGSSRPTRTARGQGLALLSACAAGRSSQ